MVDAKRPSMFQKDSKTEYQATKISDLEIQSKLVLLSLTFPRLRIIWSSSPIATTDIFKDLKINHSEPDAKKAMLVGAPDGEDQEEGGGNAGAAELLRSLPGVVSIVLCKKNKKSREKRLTVFFDCDLGRLAKTLDS